MTFQTITHECAEFGCPVIVENEDDTCEFCQEEYENERALEAALDAMRANEDWFRGDR